MKKAWLSALRCPYTYVYLIFAVFYLWYAAQIPYTHDDWGWALPIGMERLLQGNINGRYVGNLFEVIMTRSVVAKTLIVGSCCFAIPFGLSYLVTKPCTTDRRRVRVFTFVLCNLLLLTLDRSILAQTYSWIAGFANFCISTVFLLIWVREIGVVFSDTLTHKRVSPVRCILSALWCLATQLFLENVAIFTVLLALLLCAVYSLRTRKISAKLLSMTAGAIAGLGITFSSSVYDALWSTGKAVGGYRRLLFMNEGGPSEIAGVLFDQAALLAPGVYETNLVLMLCVLLFLSVLCVTADRSRGVRGVFVALNVLTMGGLIWHAADSALHHDGVLYAADGKSPVALAVGVWLFFLVLWETVWLFRRRRWVMGKLLVIWCAAPLVILPLVVTSEIGARLFFTSSFFIVLFAAELFCRVLVLLSPVGQRVVAGIGIVLSAAVLVYYGAVFTAVAHDTAVRQEVIDSALAANADTITLPSYRYEHVLCYPDPLPDVHMDYFHDYFRIPDHVEILTD